MLNVGLTGGIASGKSTVDQMFVSKGAYLIDHDALAHDAEEPDQPAWREILAFFGEEILNTDRTINRQKLAAIVFYDKHKRLALMDIVYPFVLAEWKKRLSEIEKDNPKAIVISDVPLLIESGWYKFVDVVILVYISREEQIRRMIERNGYTRQETEARLASQMSIEKKVGYAHYIIDNSGPVSQTRTEIDKIWEALLDREREN
jgi:dephospho-CoA kinase